MNGNIRKTAGFFVAALALLFPALAARGASQFEELPPGDAPIIRLEADDRPVKEAMRMISAATRWQIFCTREAGAKQFVMYTQNMMAGDLFRSIIRSQGLVYRVEGSAIYVMTLDEFNEIYGGAKEVIQLTYASAQQVAAALKPLTAADGAQVTALPEAAAVVIYDSPANIEVLKKVVEKLDRPLETAVVRLDNALAGDVAAALQRFVSPMGGISADTQSNQVIISEIAGRLQALVETAGKMDVPSTKVTREFRLKNAECSTVAQYLADMFGLQTSAAAESVVRGGREAGRAEAGQQQQPQAPQQAAGEQRRQERVNQPGQQGSPAARREFFRRERFAETLRQAVAPTTAGGTSGAAVGTAVADVRTNSVWVTDTPERIEQIASVIKGLDTALETQTYRFSYANPAEMGLDEKLAGILLSPFDRYQVDARTRCVSVTTTPERMEAVLSLLAEWDVMPRQVYITGKVLAVNRDHLRDIGVSYDALVHQMDEHINTEIQATGSFLPVIPATPKGSIRFGDVAEDNFTVLIEALESDSTTRLLSSPRVLVLDGGEATFFVATEEPYTEVVVDGNTQTTLESVKFKKVGVTLGVAPRIAQDDRIAMLVTLEVSSLQEVRNGVPVVSTSQMTSDVLIADGRPLIIGGLITDQDVDTVDKVPILGDMPLLGALFRNTRKDRSQRELVLIIVPSIVGPEPLAPEPTIADLERDVKEAAYLGGEKGEGESPAGAGVPSKGAGEGDAI